MKERFAPLIDRDQIARRIGTLAELIRRDHEGVPITAVVVLKGSFVFAADLLRALWPAEVDVEFLAVRSYAGTRSTGNVQLTHDVGVDLTGRHVLIVEDIVDTGRTLRFLADTFALRRPASLRVVTLLDKPSRREVPFQPDYVGFTIPDVFVVGYGLDLDGRYRHLPHIAVHDPDA